jgi:hypothetical protein
MKYKSIVLSILLILFTVYSCSCSDYSIRVDSEETKETIRMGNLEIMINAFPKKMNWHDANNACNVLGNGWRLPKIEELRYIAKKTKGGMIWTSTEKGGIHAIVGSVTSQPGGWVEVGEEWPTLKTQFNLVVPVRKINVNRYSK